MKVPRPKSFKKGRSYLAKRLSNSDIVKVTCLRGGKNPVLFPVNSGLGYSTDHFAWITHLPTRN